MKKSIFKFLCMVLTFALMISLAACGSSTGSTGSSATNTAQQGTSAEVKNSQPVELPFMVRNEGNDSGTKLREKLIADFNEKFKGQYEIKIEWVPGLAAEYRSKLKMLNAANNLPALVTDLAAEPAFGDLLIKNNRLMDLKPYYDQSPDWQKLAFEESVKFNITQDGKMFTAPAVISDYVGIFYNKELFTKAGITEFPTTWDDFWKACEKLKAAGITPISLHTTETGWCSMLTANAFLAASKEGQDFINTKYPTNFDVPAVNDAMGLVNKMFGYSTPDAVGGNYALAANNFASGKTAMIPNGPWMIASLSDPQFAPEGFDKKVSYGQFPEGVMLSNQGQNYGEAVSMDHPLEVREGVVEWLKYNATEDVIRQFTIAQGNMSSKVKLTDEQKAQLSPVMRDYAKAVETLKTTALIYQNQWDPIVQNEVIPKELPSMAMGKLTVKEFIGKLNEGAQKYAQQNK